MTDAVRQKNCATTAMKSRNSAQPWLIDVCQMYVTALPPALEHALRVRDRERHREAAG